MVDALESLDLDAYLAVDRSDVRYLTGFTGSAGVVLVTAQDTVLFTDGRYTEQAQAQSPTATMVTTRTYVVSAMKAVVENGARRCGTDPHHLAWSDAESARSLIDGHAELVAAPGTLAGLRSAKDAYEIEALRRACNVTDQAFAALIPRVVPGVTERELARAFREHVEGLGADGLSFDSIVAAGSNAALPHHEPSLTELQVGDLVIFDLGALVDGYHADMSRTVVIGEPAPWQREIYEVVQAAQHAGVQALQPGVLAGEIDARARSVIKAAGFGEHFVHGTGHGVGLDIHEAPILGTGADDRIGASFAVTVEPGIYLPGRGGVRIEDTVLVQSDGAQSLTTTSRDLLVVG